MASHLTNDSVSRNGSSHLITDAVPVEQIEEPILDRNLSYHPFGPVDDEEEGEEEEEQQPGTTFVNEKPEVKKGGRRKINIEFIENKSRRHVTFSKRKAGLIKKAYELSTLTGTQVLLLVASETGNVYTFATPKLQPLITKPEGKTLIQSCLNPLEADVPPSPPSPPSLPPYRVPLQNNVPNEEPPEKKPRYSNHKDSFHHVPNHQPAAIHSSHSATISTPSTPSSLWNSSFHDQQNSSWPYPPSAQMYQISNNHPYGLSQGTQSTPVGSSRNPTTPTSHGVYSQVSQGGAGYSQGNAARYSFASNASNSSNASATSTATSLLYSAHQINPSAPAHSDWSMNNL